MKSIEDTKIENAYNYAFNYYKQHGRSLDNQHACINQMVVLTGFDHGTCVKIQNPVLSIMMYNGMVELGNTMVQQQLNTVTGIIRSHLLNINHGNVQNNQSSDYGFKNLQTPYVSKTPSYTAQEMIGWLEHTNSTQNLQFNLPYKEINLSGKSVADGDMVFFAQRMSNFTFHLDGLQINHNPFGDSGIQALFNCTFTVPLGRSVVHLKLNNCNFGDVGAELISAYVRDGYMPATRSIDVSGNKITQNGWESFAAAVKKVKANTITIKVAAADTLQGMKEFLTKGFKPYTQTHKVVVNKEFQDELLGLKTSACEKTKDNVLKAAYTAGFIQFLTNGNDYFILAAGAKAGAEALISQDTLDCCQEIIGGLKELYDE